MKNKIIIGTANFNLNYRLKNNNKLNKAKINEILKYCYRNKINFFDTARNYDKSESIIGEFNHKNNIKNFKIITKFKLSNSQALQSDYLDSYKKLQIKPWCILLHDAKKYIDNNYRKELFNLKKENKIKKIGVSVYTEKEILEILKIEKPDIIQLPINILDQKLVHNGLLKRIKDNNIEIHARSIFLRGLLYYAPSQIINIFPQIKKEILFLHKIAQSNDISLGDLSLIWVNKIKEIDKIILGVSSTTDIKSNLILINKKIENNYFEKINKINITNQNIINPSKWKKKF